MVRNQEIPRDSPSWRTDPVWKQIKCDGDQAEQKKNAVWYHLMVLFVSVLIDGMVHVVMFLNVWVISLSVKM
jgi:hypothetical protein